MLTVFLKRIIPKSIFKALQPWYHFSLAWIAAFVYGRPSEKMIIIGVTGTTGKTTTVYLLAKILREAGYNVGYTSTSFFSDGVRDWANDKKMTMLGRFFIQRMLRKMLNNKCRYAIIETTSEGIRQFRHRFINYDILLFTGLYPEHIESHGGFDNYKKAKGELFNHLRRCKQKFIDKSGGITIKKPISSDLKEIVKTTVLNLDDDNAEYFKSFWSQKKIGFTKKEGVEIGDLSEIFRYEIVDSGLSGSVFKFNEQEIKVGFLGDFNVKNAVSAICVSLSQRIDIRLITKALSEIKGVDGRMEMIKSDCFSVMIDYAFEPKALESLYGNIKKFGFKDIIHVLGSCGGGRDKSRREIMGQIAARNADYVIITNEDPYDDDPMSIINDVSRGVTSIGKREGENFWRIEDRRLAIRKALSLADKDSLVLVTGKGSEKAMCLSDGKKVPWDDISVAKDEMLSMGVKNT